MRLVAAAKGWLPRGGRETVKTTFSKRSVKVFGALGKRALHLMPARSARSSAFKIFLETPRQEYGKVVFVTNTQSPVIQNSSKTASRRLRRRGSDIPACIHPAAESD